VSADWKALCRAREIEVQPEPALAVRERATATWSASELSEGTFLRQVAAAFWLAGIIQLLSA
jgi:hypothetical protein